MADNSITVIGNITRDPELRYTPSGQSPLAEPPEPELGGVDIVLRRHVLGEPGRQRL